MKHNSIRIKVNLKFNPYEVVIGNDYLNEIGNELSRLGIKPGTKILVISNPDVAGPYSDLFIKNLKESGYQAELLVIEAGEDQKNQSSINLIHNAAYELKLERSSVMIALGGGVIGDMTGFAAATWLRGIPFVQVPTTLLAMVDASIGGKTGINHPKGKNLIGAFHQPKVVIIDPKTLQTLPNREFKAGLAEIIKYGVIGDKKLFETLEAANEIKTLELLGKDLLIDIIRRSANSKALIVKQDEYEGGLRAILNYGHTFGHVIETLTGYGVWIHGEAVSLGMIAIGELALQKKLWTSEDNKRQKDLLYKAGLPIHWPKLKTKEVLNSLQSDKKVKNGHVRFIVPTSIGEVKISTEITNSDIENCLSTLNAHSNQ